MVDRVEKWRKLSQGRRKQERRKAKKGVFRGRNEGIERIRMSGGREDRKKRIRGKKKERKRTQDRGRRGKRKKGKAEVETTEQRKEGGKK